MEALREEAAEAARARQAAEAELGEVLAGVGGGAAAAGLMGPEYVPVPREEYQRLLKQAAEARAREATAVLQGGGVGGVSMGAAQGSSVSGEARGGAAGATEGTGEGVEGHGREEEQLVAVPCDVHRRLLAAVQERDVLAAQVAQLHAAQLHRTSSTAAAATESAFAGAVAAAAAAAAAGAAAAGGLRRGSSSGGGGGEGQDETASALAAAAVSAGYEAAAEVIVLREQLASVVAASVAESGRLGARLRELEDELDLLRTEVGGTTCGSSELA